MTVLVAICLTDLTDHSAASDKTKFVHTRNITVWWSGKINALMFVEL